ncbi:DoxX family protein [Thermanaerothrix daxensis]|uniref:DoxX family protein n=1 Tax=Thermanaerothrix daxensis TaxID=869279 RepID=A0A0P6XS30_9CHLR|nr:DoxX family protein [Thermanaerothrix daxensis]KPL83225.1 DoxX family protein [Thermanaerothrix daxensis]
MATSQLAKSPTFASPPWAELLFRDPKSAWFWLVVRLYLGYSWLEHGLEKLSNPAWVQTGEALKGFWQRAVAIPEPPARPPIAFDWYRAFIQSLLDSGSYTWFSKLVVFGEIAVGIALILGIFVWFSAFMGGFMNWNFMMAGTASTNPVMLILAILLVLAWRTAGWIGLDRWLLVYIGTPWQPGLLFQRKTGTQA